MNGKPNPNKSEIPYNSNIQERIFQAANIDYGKFRTPYKQLKQFYKEHPEKVERLLRI